MYVYLYEHSSIWVKEERICIALVWTICCFSETLILPKFSILKDKKVPPNKLLSMLYVNKPLGLYHFRRAFCYIELSSWPCLELFGRWKSQNRHRCIPCWLQEFWSVSRGPIMTLSSLLFTIFCDIDLLLLPGPLSLRSCRTTWEVICVWKSVLAFCYPLVLHVPSAGGYSPQGQKCSWWWSADRCECTEDRGAKQRSIDFITQRWVVS